MKGCISTYANEERKSAPARNVVVRLAAYEDTGLMPDEITAMRFLEEKLYNDPLTLEELRKMNGEPVWIVESPEWGHWEMSEDAEDYLMDREEAL